MDDVVHYWEVNHRAYCGAPTPRIIGSLEETTCEACLSKYGLKELAEADLGDGEIMHYCPHHVHETISQPIYTLCGLTANVRWNVWYSNQLAVSVGNVADHVNCRVCLDRLAKRVHDAC